MIELSPAFVIILLEALLILILLALIMPMLRYKKYSATQNAALALIKRLEKNQSGRTDQLEQIINNSTDLEPEQLTEFLEEIKVNETNFYQHILRMFLNKDSELLKKIDKNVQNLSEPYCKLLSHSASATSNNHALTDELERSRQEISRLNNEIQAFSKQMETAVSTMNEVSVEYTQIFSGTRTELELQNSSKKMLKLFHESGQQIKQAHQQSQARTS